VIWKSQGILFCLICGNSDSAERPSLFAYFVSIWCYIIFLFSHC